jgi:hypothetical protein
MIIKGVWYQDDLFRFRLRRVLTETVWASVSSGGMGSRPTLHFTAKDRSAKNIPLNGGGKPSTAKKSTPAGSPYWSKRIVDYATDKIDAEYIAYSKFPITSTAVMGGNWEAAIAGYIYNKFLRDRILRGGLRGAGANAASLAAVAYVAGTTIAIHDVGVLYEQPSNSWKRKFLLEGWKMPSGFGGGIGSAIT